MDRFDLSAWNMSDLDVLELTRDLQIGSFTNLTKQEFVNQFVRWLACNGVTSSILNECNNAEEEWCAPPHLDVVRRYNTSVHGYLALLVCVFGTISNISNIWVLMQNIYYTQFHRILKWLAICDCLVMVEYIPFSIYKYVLEEGSGSGWERRRGVPGDSSEWAARLVLWHMIYSQLFHTASICLTVTLAVWRWIALKFPHHSSRLCSKNRCTIAIICCFVLPPLLSIPSYMVFRVREVCVFAGGTTERVFAVETGGGDDALFAANFVLHAVALKLAPCALLLAASAWLVRALRGVRSRRRALGRRASSEEHTTRLLLAVLALFLATELPQAALGLSSALAGRCFFLGCYNLFGELLDLLALANGAVTLALYCAMSQQFRCEFRRLFRFARPPPPPTRPDSNKFYSSDLVQTTLL